MARIVSDGIANCQRNFPIWCFLYTSKLVLAAVFSIPLFVTVNAQLENSHFAAALLTSWSLDVVGELVVTRDDVVTSFVVMLMFYSVVAFLFKQFVNGGIYSSLLSGQRARARDFFGESAALLGGHLKISALMVMMYIPLVVVSQAVASLLPDNLFLDFGAVSAWRILVRLVLLYPFLTLAVILSDLLRFRLSACPRERLPAGLKAALDIYRARFVQLNGIYYLYLLPLAAIWILIQWLALRVTGGSGNMLGVVIEVVLLQLCSFLRTGQSLLPPATVAVLLRRERSNWLPESHTEARA